MFAEGIAFLCIIIMMPSGPARPVYDSSKFLVYIYDTTCWGMRTFKWCAYSVRTLCERTGVTMNSCTNWL